MWTFTTQLKEEGRMAYQCHFGYIYLYITTLVTLN